MNRLIIHYQGVGEVTSTTRAVSKAKATKAAYDKRKREKARQRKAEAAKKAEDKQILEALSAMSIDPKISDTNGTSGANSPSMFTLLKKAVKIGGI